MSKVTIVDYGIGNLLSVARAFAYCGAEVSFTDSPSGIFKAERLVLPGVGAFADGMSGLRTKGLIKPIQEYAAKDRPFLGICLGMQMMLESSEEFGMHEGLGLVPGAVIRISDIGTDLRRHKIPHIGWSQLCCPTSKISWEGSILHKVPPGNSVYFVHSFSASPTDNRYRLADSYYNGRIISAAIRSNNSYGCQFHPEKSGIVGLAILKSFLMI